MHTRASKESFQFWFCWTLAAIELQVLKSLYSTHRKTSLRPSWDRLSNPLDYMITHVYMLLMFYRLQADHVIKWGSLNVIKLKTHSLAHYKSLVATLEPSEKLRGLKININRAHSEYSKILFFQIFAFLFSSKITNQNIKLNETTLRMKILKKYHFCRKLSNIITIFFLQKRFFCVDFYRKNSTNSV